jgi:hypothetical protein
MREQANQTKVFCQPRLSKKATKREELALKHVNAELFPFGHKDSVGSDKPGTPKWNEA